MQSAQGRGYPHIPDHLVDVLATACQGDVLVYDLFNDFFAHGMYQRTLACKLIDVANGTLSTVWETRSIATLMLEHIILKLPSACLDEFLWLFEKLALISPAAGHVQLKDSVCKEGYSTTDIRGFIREFLRKLAKLQHIHAQIKGQNTSAEGLYAFLAQGQRECKLSLARYLFSAEEVVARILGQVRVSRGVRDPLGQSCVAEEAEWVCAGLPDFEARILTTLWSTSKIYWVAETTSTELNALVEAPVSTVVLVVKPPGSDREFEIKRAGQCGRQPLRVVYAREGRAVPFAHRLHGGSMGSLLHWEARAAALLAQVYRLVHGREAPVSKTVATSSIYALPVPDGEAHILRYFTAAPAFGVDFDHMRSAMTQVVAAFEQERGSRTRPLPGALGLTVQFLSQVTPKQSILTGTSAFRLDRLATYLSAAGPQAYFQQGRQVAYTPMQARCFADEVLEEVLGVYTPPAVAYETHAQYVAAAFAVQANRARAEQHYLAVLQQIGTFWGTVWGLRGYSHGESFVARNVGLKSVWEDGQWQVKIVFMDHDNLHFVGQNSPDFHPTSVLPGMLDDAIHICGGPMGGKLIQGDVGHLDEIYRVAPQVRIAGHRALYSALEEAYRKTTGALLYHPRLKELLYASYVTQMRHWDTVVDLYLHCGGSPAWSAAARTFLGARGYGEARMQEYAQAVERYAAFLTDYAFLYGPQRVTA